METSRLVLEGIRVRSGVYQLNRGLV